MTTDSAITIGKIQGIEEIDRLLAQFSAATGKDVEQGLRTAGKRLAVELCLMTWPANDVGRRKMETSIVGGLNRLFHTNRLVWMTLRKTDPKLADAFWATQVGQRKNNRKAARILTGTIYDGLPVMTSPDPAIHQAARTSKRKHVLAKKPRAIITRSASLVAYRNKIWKRIGKAAAGWAVVAKELRNTRGIPRNKGVGAHPEARGRATFTGGSRPTLVLHDQVPYADANVSTYSLSNAVQRTGRFFSNHIADILDAKAGKAIPRKRLG